MNFLNFKFYNHFPATRCADPTAGHLSDMTVRGVYYAQTVDYHCHYGCSVSPQEKDLLTEAPVVHLISTCQANGTWDNAPLVCQREYLLDQLYRHFSG